MTTAPDCNSKFLTPNRMLELSPIVRVVPWPLTTALDWALVAMTSPAKTAFDETTRPSTSTVPEPVSTPTASAALTCKGRITVIAQHTSVSIRLGTHHLTLVNL